MIEANHHPFWVKFGYWYSKFLLNIFFRNIRYVGDYNHTDKPVLIIANHFSWWDGFIHLQLNRTYFKRLFHVMMLERELSKSMILTKIGAFSINKRKLSIVETLAYTTKLLAEPKNMVLIFPQGRIQSLYTNEFVFEMGVLRSLLENVENPFQFVLNVNLIDYSSRRKPEITVYYKDYEVTNQTTSQDVQEAFNQFAKECLKKQCGK